MLRLGWFSTGRDEAARQLLQVVHEAIQRGELGAQIVFVFCNRNPGESRQSDLFMELVKSYNLTLIHHSYSEFTRQIAPSQPSPDGRAAYDRQVMKLVEGYKVDLSVLAGYMLIVSGEMCRRYPTINLHPAAPSGPRGTWQQVIWQLIEQRATSSGAMMHLVTPELDQGPAVTYCSYSLRGPGFDPLWKEIEGQPVETIQRRDGENNALFRRIRQEGLKREFPLILATLKAFSRGLVRIDKGIILDERGKAIPGYDLTAEIDAAVGVHYG